jgi:hypothetical protein
VFDQTGDRDESTFDFRPLFLGATPGAPPFNK